MRKDNIIYLNQILERAERILKFTKGYTEEDFLSDDKTQSAVIREFEVIGEAAKKIPDEFRAQYPQIARKLMAGMRDILIHDYEGIDLMSIWSTIQKDIPPLIIELLKILDKPAGN